MSISHSLHIQHSLELSISHRTMSDVAVSGAGVVPDASSSSGGFDIDREEYRLVRGPLELSERAMDVSTWGPMVDYSSSSRRCPRLVDILFPRPNDILHTEYESLNLPFMWTSDIIGNLFIVHWRSIRGILLDLTRIRIRELQAHIKQIARELEESSRAFATYMAGVNEALGPEEIVSVPHLGSAEFVRHHTITETLSKGLYDASHMLNIILKIQRELMDNQSLAFVKLPTTRASNTLPGDVPSLRTTSTDLSQWTSLVEMMPGVFGRGTLGVSPSKNTESFDIGIIRKGTAENLWVNRGLWYGQICRPGSAANCMVNRTLSFGTDPHEQAYVYDIVNRAHVSVGKTRLAFVSLIHAIDCLGVYLGPHVIVDYFRGVLPIYQWQIDARIRENFPREPVRARSGAGAFPVPVVRLGDDVSRIELPAGLLTTTETLPVGFIAGEDDEDPVQLTPFEAGEIVHRVHCCGKRFLDTTIKSLFVAQRDRLRCPMCRSPLILGPDPDSSDWVTRRDPMLDAEIEFITLVQGGRL